MYYRDYSVTRYAKGGETSKKGGKFGVNDMVMVNDSKYTKLFTGFDLTKPAKVIDVHKVKTSRGTFYTYGLEFEGGIKPFNYAMENQLSLTQDGIMAFGGEMSKGEMMEEGGAIGDSVIVELNNGKKIEGKIEKTNPFKIRTSPSSTEVIPYSYIKSVKKVSDGGIMANGGKTDPKPMSYYKYETPKVRIYWKGKVQPLGVFKSVEEAYDVIKKQYNTKSYGSNDKMSDYEIHTPDAIIKLDDGGKMAQGGVLSKFNPMDIVGKSIVLEDMKYGVTGSGRIKEVDIIDEDNIKVTYSDAGSDRLITPKGFSKAELYKLTKVKRIPRNQNKSKIY